MSEPDTTPTDPAQPVTVCRMCKYGEFPASDQPVCRAPGLQRIATLHHVYGHKCYREFKNGQTLFFNDSAPYCVDVNPFGRCPQFLERQK